MTVVQSYIAGLAIHSFALVDRFFNSLSDYRLQVLSFLLKKILKNLQGATQSDWLCFIVFCIVSTFEQELSSCWDGRPFCHNRHWPKSGETAVPLSVGGELEPRVIQCHLGRGLPPYQVASWSIQPFGHNKHGPKIGEEGCCALCVGGAGFPSNTMWPAPRRAYLCTKWHLDTSNRLATIHQRFRQTDKLDRQDNGPVA